MELHIRIYPAKSYFIWYVLDTVIWLYVMCVKAAQNKST